MTQPIENSCKWCCLLLVACDMKHWIWPVKIIQEITWSFVQLYKLYLLYHAYVWNSLSFTLLKICFAGEMTEFPTHERYSYISYNTLWKNLSNLNFGPNYHRDFKRKTVMQKLTDAGQWWTNHSDAGQWWSNHSDAGQWWTNHSDAGQWWSNHSDAGQWWSNHYDAIINLINVFFCRKPSIKFLHWTRDNTNTKITTSLDLYTIRVPIQSYTVKFASTDTLN